MHYWHSGGIGSPSYFSSMEDIIKYVKDNASEDTDVETAENTERHSPPLPLILLPAKTLGKLMKVLKQRLLYTYSW